MRGAYASRYGLFPSPPLALPAPMNQALNRAFSSVPAVPSDTMSRSQSLIGGMPVTYPHLAPLYLHEPFPWPSTGAPGPGLPAAVLSQPIPSDQTIARPLDTTESPSFLPPMYHGTVHSPTPLHGNYVPLHSGPVYMGSSSSSLPSGGSGGAITLPQLPRLSTAAFPNPSVRYPVLGSGPANATENPGPQALPAPQPLPNPSCSSDPASSAPHSTQHSLNTFSHPQSVSSVPQFASTQRVPDSLATVPMPSAIPGADDHRSDVPWETRVEAKRGKYIRVYLGISC